MGMAVQGDLAWSCPACRTPFTVTASRDFGCDACGRRLRWIDGVWATATAFRPPGFSVERRDHLHGLVDQGHFWFAPRDALVLRCLRRLGVGRASRLLELGCAQGRFLAAASGLAGRRAGVEGHLESLRRARLADPGALLVHADVAAVPLGGAQLDVAVALDVLEHVEPLPFLREAARLVRPGGHLVLSVPAVPALWSAADELAGHRCRYDVATLRAELAASGWRLVDHTHYQLVLLPLVWLSRRRHRRTAPGLERRPPRWLNRVLGAVNAAEVALWRGRVPLGSSLVAWARREAS
jgi:SAM-dependent methyltransferase